MIITSGFDGDLDPKDPDREYRKHRWQYWNTLKNIRSEYMKIVEHKRVVYESSEFLKYIEKTYGFRPIVTHYELDGDMITDKYEIVDERLYTYFLLKWG